MRCSFFAVLVVACAGCSTPQGGPERGPQGTIAYEVQIETDEPGSKIEVNGEYVGQTPCTVKLWGDKDGTFHNFGSSTWVVTAHPLHAGQTLQTKTFYTGGWFQREDRIPKRIYLDLNLDAVKPKERIDINVNQNSK